MIKLHDYTMRIYIKDGRSKTGERIHATFAYPKTHDKWMKEEVRDLRAGAYPSPKYRFEVDQIWDAKEHEIIETRMNRANIQATIEILRRAQNFNINDFQDNGKKGLEARNFNYAKTEDELHSCGNTACVAGYIAISPEWKSFGGKSRYGEPVLNQDLVGSDSAAAAMRKFWGLSDLVTEAIIYGDQYSQFVNIYSIQGMPSQWNQLEKKDAISLFEQLLNSNILKEV